MTQYKNKKKMPTYASEEETKKKTQKSYCRPNCSSPECGWRASVSQEVPTMRIEVRHIGMRLTHPSCLTDVWLFETLASVMDVLFAKLFSVRISSPIVLRCCWGGSR